MPYAVGFVGPRMFAARRAAEAARPTEEKVAAEAAQQHEIEERQRRDVWSRPEAWSRWG